MEESGRRRPAAACTASLLGEVGEGPVTIVVIQHVVAVAGDVQIGEPVVVIIAGRHAHAVVHFAGAGEPGALSYVGKTAVAILAVQTIPVCRIAAREPCRRLDRVVQTAAVYKENIEQPVIIEIEKGHATAHSVYQVLLPGGRIAVHEVDTGRPGD